MFHSFLSLISSTKLLAFEFDMMSVLIIVGIFFFILIVLGIRKTYKLNQENRRLNELHAKQLEIEKEKEKEGYKDFTEGHLYENNDK